MKEGDMIICDCCKQPGQQITGVVSRKPERKDPSRNVLVFSTRNDFPTLDLCPQCAKQLGEKVKAVFREFSQPPSKGS